MDSRLAAQAGLMSGAQAQIQSEKTLKAIPKELDKLNRNLVVLSDTIDEVATRLSDCLSEPLPPIGEQGIGPQSDCCVLSEKLQDMNQSVTNATSKLNSILSRLEL